MRNVRRSYPARRFPRSLRFFFSSFTIVSDPPAAQHPSPVAALRPVRRAPRVTLNLQREIAIPVARHDPGISPCLGPGRCSAAQWRRQRRRFEGLLFIFVAFRGVSFSSFNSRAPWFYDLPVMGLSDNPVSCLDVPFSGIFQLARGRAPRRPARYFPSFFGASVYYEDMQIKLRVSVPCTEFKWPRRCAGALAAPGICVPRNSYGSKFAGGFGRIGHSRFRESMITRWRKNSETEKHLLVFLRTRLKGMFCR